MLPSRSYSYESIIVGICSVLMSAGGLGSGGDVERHRCFMWGSGSVSDSGEYCPDGFLFVDLRSSMVGVFDTSVNEDLKSHAVFQGFDYVWRRLDDCERSYDF